MPMDMRVAHEILPIRIKKPSIFKEAISARIKNIKSI